MSKLMEQKGISKRIKKNTREWPRMVISSRNSRSFFYIRVQQERRSLLGDYTLDSAEMGVRLTRVLHYSPTHFYDNL